MGMMKDYKIKEIDQLKNPLKVKQFYNEYVSKSLPLVFRNEIKE